MKISDLKANPKNPRIIKDDKFKKLVKSLQEFPEMMEKRPMVCVTDVDGKLFPLGGNMRLKALQELKYKDVPDEWVMLADEWTEEKRQEFVIKDNVGFGEWDWDELNADWDTQQLEEWGLEVPDFEEEELEAVEDDYEIPDIIETDIVLGDLFEIGEHRLLCGSSTDINVIDINNFIMSTNIDIILLIFVCFIILIIHAVADYNIHTDRNGIEEINSAILRDIVIVIIYLFTKYTIINL